MLRRVYRFKWTKNWTRDYKQQFYSNPQTLIISDRAVERLRHIAKEGERLRITVEGGGCAGFEYKLKLDNENQPDDVIVEKDGASVVVDEISLDFVKGSTIDYTEDLMKSAFRVTNNPLATQGCSCGVSFAPKDLGAESSGNGNNNEKEDRNQGSTTGTKTLLGLSVLATVKDFLGMEEMKLDDDPVKDKIKQAMLYRRHNQFDKALDVLHEALEEVKKLGEEMSITRVIYEVAITHYLAEDFEKAEETFRFVISRLIQLHHKKDNSPEFIGISLKLADIFARRGDLQNAEIGYRHCVSKQMNVMEEHMKNYYIAKGAHMEEPNKAEFFGPKYTDPLALFGMCLEQFAHFLINYHDESREKEAIEYMDEVLKLSYHIYGPSNFHSINLMNNFGAACILRNRFEIARKYLEVGIERILHNNECAPLIVGYYCNYAEALFHSGQIEEALKYAEKAVRLSRSEPDRVQNYAKRFFKDLQRDQRRVYREKAYENKRDSGPSGESSSWFSWPWSSATKTTETKTHEPSNVPMHSTACFSVN
ncbi:FeS cluster biogenesis domain containing protein [Aphelenchoides besseyi]|nr:FeS cluster biogenesis domain containing protein [Aphelenchoides besseyi]KAI6194679.1 FeS cluster biogenesis domain containing protein [Aphelenchoides besseyi]